MDSHLRCINAVTGYRIEATDGEIGHADGFMMDAATWAVRYVEVATRNWWPGKKVLVSPAWIERVSWEDSKVCVDGDRLYSHDGRRCALSTSSVPSLNSPLAKGLALRVQSLKEN
jgi:hypothetical protein